MKQRTRPVSHPLGNSPDRQDARPVQVLVELAGFNELIILNILLHLLSWADKVVVLSVHLVLSPRTSRICRWVIEKDESESPPPLLHFQPAESVGGSELTRHAGAKLVRELGDEVVVYSVFHGTQDDDWPCVVDCKGTARQPGLRPIQQETQQSN